MKYLKVFKNASDYQEFRGGGDYMTPNICLLEDNYNIVLEPKGEVLKQFSILRMGLSQTERKYFNFKEGMTWGEWINSEYCVDWYFYIQYNKIYFKTSTNSAYEYAINTVNVNDNILEIDYNSIYDGGGN